MDANVPLVNLSPLAWLVAIGALIALLALAWVWRVHRKTAGPSGDRSRDLLRALTVFTLFLTFDLVVFGAFTRLSDSGLGCPDWPGCYGQSNPLAAHPEIQAAQAALPTGPVTVKKAWIEMIHRYLATGVGALIVVLMGAHLRIWWQSRTVSSGARPADRSWVRPGLAALVFVWVCAQGAFGALTVTWKLYPAIVTAHLLGGIGLLALLAIQVQTFDSALRINLSAGVRLSLWLFLFVVLIQVTLGGWVSTNYAVLACPDFPTCHGSWWPQADYIAGFTVQRPLGRTGTGEFLPFAALTAIHWVHRLFAIAVVLTGLAAAYLLRRAARQNPADVLLARAATAIALWLLWQVASGLSNVVLDWPLLAALAHTAGAAVAVAGLCWLLARTTRAPVPGLSPTRVRHDAAASGPHLV